MKNKEKIPRKKELIFRAMWIKALTLGACLGSLLSTPLALSLNEPLLLLLGTILGIVTSYAIASWAPMDLSDWQIFTLKKVITPFNPELIESDSYDITLADQFTRIKPDGTTETFTAEELTIGPQECLLAHTEQTFCFPNNIKGLLQGKSSWARLSLFVECAGLFDKGFEGTAVLELYNAGKWAIKLKKGDRIAQMSFHRTLPAAIPYGDNLLKESHYQYQQGAKSSWLTKENRVVPRS